MLYGVGSKRGTVERKIQLSVNYFCSLSESRSYFEATMHLSTYMYLSSYRHRGRSESTFFAHSSLA